jgi:hypothetical protein
MDTFIKDPDATLDYHRDWSEWLVDGDTITSSEWIVPDDFEVGTGEKAPSFTSSTATVWLSGGEPRRAYRVTNRITTTQGRVDDRSLVILVRER